MCPSATARGSQLMQRERLVRSGAERHPRRDHVEEAPHGECRERRGRLRMRCSRAAARVSERDHIPQLVVVIRVMSEIEGDVEIDRDRRQP